MTTHGDERSPLLDAARRHSESDAVPPPQPAFQSAGPPDPPGPLDPPEQLETADLTARHSTGARSRHHSLYQTHARRPPIPPIPTIPPAVFDDPTAASAAAFIADRTHAYANYAVASTSPIIPSSSIALPAPSQTHPETPPAHPTPGIAASHHHPHPHLQPSSSSPATDAVFFSNAAQMHPAAHSRPPTIPTTSPFLLPFASTNPVASDAVKSVAHPPASIRQKNMPNFGFPNTANASIDSDSYDAIANSTTDLLAASQRASVGSAPPATSGTAITDSRPNSASPRSVHPSHADTHAAAGLLDPGRHNKNTLDNPFYLVHENAPAIMTSIAGGVASTATAAGSSSAAPVPMDLPTNLAAPLAREHMYLPKQISDHSTQPIFVPKMEPSGVLSHEQPLGASSVQDHDRFSDKHAGMHANLLHQQQQPQRRKIPQNTDTHPPVKHIQVREPAVSLLTGGKRTVSPTGMMHGSIAASQLSRSVPADAFASAQYLHEQYGVTGQEMGYSRSSEHPGYHGSLPDLSGLKARHFPGANTQHVEYDHAPPRPAASPQYSLDYDRLAQAFEPLPPPRPGARFERKRYMFFSEATDVVRAPTFEEIDLTGFDRSVRELLEEGAFWLDVCQATPTEMTSISRAFGIHPLTTEDIQTPDTREKCEAFSNYYFVVIRSFEQDQSSPNFMQPIPVYIVIFREGIVSFHFTPNPHANNVLSRIEQLRMYGLHITSDWISYALIDDIIDSFIFPSKFIELEVDSIDDLVLILKESEQSDMLRRIGHTRKRVMQLLRLLSTKADVVKAVIHRYMERLAPDSETRLYLEDIHDHVITLVQNLMHYENTLSRSHSNYLAQISIEITQASNRTSDVVMRMTALASMLVPLNVITGLWGMNVPVPGQGTDSLQWFFWIVSAMLVIAAVTFYAIRRANLV